MPIDPPVGAVTQASSASKSVPRVLYRYAGASEVRLQWIRRLLIASELYFTSPRTFNDPFDCRGVSIEFAASPLKARQHWRKEARSAYPDEPLRKQKGTIERLIAEARTSEGRERLKKSIFDAVAEQGVVCLSKQPANMLMWSHYAEGHKGIVVRFNMQTMPWTSLLDLIPVQYGTQFPRVNWYEIREKHHPHMLILSTKALAWAHEEEWRLVMWVEPGMCAFRFA